MSYFPNTSSINTVIATYHATTGLQTASTTQPFNFSIQDVDTHMGIEKVN